MSLLPLVFDNALRDFRRLQHRSGSLFDQHFGMGVFDDGLLSPNWIVSSVAPRYLCPLVPKGLDSAFSDVVNSKDCFKVNIDVQQFKPDEISVKTTDNCIVVEGKHEERKDEHGFISRQFQRRYCIPDDVDPQTIVSKLSSDGVLSIEATKKAEQLVDKERVIPIARTNAPAVVSQQSPQLKEESNQKTESNVN